MGTCGKLIVLVSTVLLSFGGFKIKSVLYDIPDKPNLPDTWWGPGSPQKEDTTIKPFKINVPESVIKDLHNRIDNARTLTSPLENVQQNYGMNSNLLKKIVHFWRNEYNWKEREAFLNQYPQFKVSVQGLKIHYIHVKPENPKNLKVFPLLILHGWPGSVREHYEMISLLTKPQRGRDFVFEVIVPSLPGYGFSEATSKPGLGAAQMAVIFKNLMKTIGFKKYYLQGGDWGAIITQTMAIMYPEYVLGIHSNMCGVNTPLSNFKLFLYSFYPSLAVDKKHEHLVYPMSNFFQYILLESGYMHLQATKPDTAGMGLNDSPVGLAAYIIEKFTTWTNRNWKNLDDGGLTKKFTYTNLLDNIMIYWINEGSITTSMRLYAETCNKAQISLGLDGIPVTVPSACARFNEELVYPIAAILEDKYPNLIHLSDHDGGHFAAFEAPEVLAADIYAFVEKVQQIPKNKKAEL